MSGRKRNLIRRKEVRRRTSLSNSTIWRGEQANTFPRRVLLDPKAGPQGGVGYYEDEIDQWIIDRIRGTGRPLPIKGGRKAKPAQTDGEAAA